MLESVVDKIGSRIYARSIEPLRRCAVYKGAIFGFDTEYTSNGQKLLSYQLCYQGKSIFKRARGRLDIDEIIAECCKLAATKPDQILLATYFSLAELQHMPVRGGALMVREFARGSLDVTFVSSKRRTVELEVFDLARWFDFQSLKNAAKSIGEKKLEFAARRKMTWEKLNTPKGIEYAKHDAYLCERLLNELRAKFAEQGIDMVTARTAANASSQVFRLHHIGPDEKLFCDKNRARYAACMGCWGGRAEVFERGALKGTFYEVDLKGAYPRAAIALAELPVQKSWREAKTLGELDRMRGGFAKVRFRFPAGTRYPSIPVQSDAGTSIYPLSGEGWTTFSEITLARSLRGKVELLEAWGYKTGSTALRDYMQSVLEKRASATGAARHMYKLLANALIGKFAQRTDRPNVSRLFDLAKKTRTLIEDLVQMNFAELSILAREFGIELDQFSLGPVWMPEWNGLITGYTRAQLGKEIARAHPVYCHTDSLWVRSPRGFDPKIWEEKGHGKAVVARTRFAALFSRGGDNHIAHHSVWSMAVAEQMLKRFRGDADIVRRYPKSRPLKYREALKKDDTPGRWITKDDVGYWHRASTAWDGKRRLLADGTTEPWENIGQYLGWVEKTQAKEQEEYE